MHHKEREGVNVQRKNECEGVNVHLWKNECEGVSV